MEVRNNYGDFEILKYPKTQLSNTEFWTCFRD